LRPGIAIVKKHLPLAQALFSRLRAARGFARPGRAGRETERPDRGLFAGPAASAAGASRSCPGTPAAAAGPLSRRHRATPGQQCLQAARRPRRHAHRTPMEPLPMLLIPTRLLLPSLLAACVLGMLPGNPAMAALPPSVDGKPLPTLAPMIERVTP